MPEVIPESRGYSSVINHSSRKTLRDAPCERRRQRRVEHRLPLTVDSSECVARTRLDHRNPSSRSALIAPYFGPSNSLCASASSRGAAIRADGPRRPSAYVAQ